MVEREDSRGDEEMNQKRTKQEEERKGKKKMIMAIPASVSYSYCKNGSNAPRSCQCGDVEIRSSCAERIGREALPSVTLPPLTIIAGGRSA